MSPARMIDIPPVWLAGAIALLWVERQTTGGLDTGAWGLWGGRVLIGLGLLLMVAAIWEFMRAKTSPIPHTEPAAIITSGIFARTRNPIYLGDALVLAGFGLGWGAVSTLIVLPLFVALIDRRFIKAEEKRLEAHFQTEFSAYKLSVRRWI